MRPPSRLSRWSGWWGVSEEDPLDRPVETDHGDQGRERERHAAAVPGLPPHPETDEKEGAADDGELTSLDTKGSRVVTDPDLRLDGSAVEADMDGPDEPSTEVLDAALL